MSHQHHKGFIGFILSWKGFVLVLVLAGVSYYLLTQHLAHLAVAMPYMILLACPLIHIFAHGHGGHLDHREDKE